MSLTNEQRAHDWAIEAMKTEINAQTKALLANQPIEIKSALELYLKNYKIALEFFEKHFD